MKNTAQKHFKSTNRNIVHSAIENFLNDGICDMTLDVLQENNVTVDQLTDAFMHSSYSLEDIEWFIEDYIDYEM